METAKAYTPRQIVKVGKAGSHVMAKGVIARVVSVEGSVDENAHFAACIKAGVGFKEVPNMTYTIEMAKTGIPGKGVVHHAGLVFIEPVRVAKMKMSGALG